MTVARDLPLPGLEDRRRGYRGPAVARVIGITYRQLDYWDTTGLVKPTVAKAVGSGTQRLYNLDDIVMLRMIKRLIDAGVSLQRIRPVITYIREHRLPLRTLTVASDGTTIRAVKQVSEIAEMLRDGRGVFAIAVDQLYEETARDVFVLPSEPVAPIVED